ncbi:CobW family GTP-binding protein [Paenibacillus sp. SYP-B4298]|uniref:CobW family GTP-binding protein n=1 Tax=Paenibacillus sp. SYP-B4298 TaxID=2996034 RepID=UPI0022DDED88|nr:CobW family GTP-binding protein [Paenibacillus sp. SYP-B4298]
MTLPKGPIPIHLLTGFLGSGKTTLLARLIDYYQAMDSKVAVVMNELGDINLDGVLVDRQVPMSEMLGGCICCSIRGDLGVEIQQLIAEHQPDVLLIESTGAANPLEIIDGVTEAALFTEVDLRTIITVVDGPELLRRSRDSKGATFKLMKEQIRCATQLLINKADLLEPEQLVEAQQLVREWNAKAALHVAVRTVVDPASLLGESGVEYRSGQQGDRDGESENSSHGRTSHHPQQHESCGHGCAHDHHGEADYGGQAEQGALGKGEHHNVHSAGDDEATDHYAQERYGHEKPAHGSHSHASHAHQSHEHVMAVTYYLSAPVDGELFEAFLKQLPDDIYRAKGVVTFAETSSRFMFQYAYRETDFLRINPQGKVNDVAVFIGEHFSKELLLERLHELERTSAELLSSRQGQ